jgi:benzoate/toluate 1,2-dioxygenase reductase subunit
VSFRARIAEVEVSTPRSRLLHLELDGAAFGYRAGQAVLLGRAGPAERWPFSIACSPGRAAETERLEVLVALSDDGSEPSIPASAGTMLDLVGPLGDFTLPGAVGGRRLLFVAGGTGIAPLRAMLDQALRVFPENAVSLLYSARRREEFAFLGEFQAHADAGRIELHQTVTRAGGAWHGRRGRVSRSHFSEVLHDPAATECFVCGPPSMVRDSVDTLTRLDVPPNRVHYEQWGA